MICVCAMCALAEFDELPFGSYSAHRSARRGSSSHHDPSGLASFGRAWIDGGEAADFNWHIEHKQRAHRKTSRANNGYYGTVRTFASIDITHIWEWFFAIVAPRALTLFMLFLYSRAVSLLLAMYHQRRQKNSELISLWIMMLGLTDILNWRQNHFLSEL